MGLSRSYNVDNKDTSKNGNAIEQPMIPHATLFQHSDSLPAYLLQNTSHSHNTSRKTFFGTNGAQPASFLEPNSVPIKQEDRLDRFGSIPEETQNDQSQSQFSLRNKSSLCQQQEKKRTNFLSSAADLEYSTLSSILQENVLGFNPNHLATSTEGTPNSLVISPAISPHGYGLTKHSPPALPTSNFPPDNNQGMPSEMQDNSQERKSTIIGNETSFYDPKINQFQLGFTATDPNVSFPRMVEILMKLNDPNAFRPLHPHLHPSFTIGVSQSETDSGHNGNLQFKEPEEIYAKITKPFLYTPGFHKLIAYLRGRFSRDKLVKMAESMAVYRPSFIACTNSLREHDLIFMEQCFQRTLLTYDNFIKISGTPTIVWRRTGEIAYVGKEFTILTGWTKQQLIGTRPTFIVELLDDQSVVEYFQLFSKIAFGDFLGATMTECTLLTPTKDVKIRTGCIWTLKRDVFGIPMMIIGNFLPII